MDDQKRQVEVIEDTIRMTKEGYADSLKELEKISEEIHAKRQLSDKKKYIDVLGEREDPSGDEDATDNHSELPKNALKKSDSLARVQQLVRQYSKGEIAFLYALD